jgi:hypothetical protein
MRDDRVHLADISAKAGRNTISWRASYAPRLPATIGDTAIIDSILANGDSVIDSKAKTDKFTPDAASPADANESARHIGLH